MRWTYRRKAALVTAVAKGERTLEDVCRENEILPEEFAEWVRLTKQGGEVALKTTKLQRYRQTTTTKPTRQGTKGRPRRTKPPSPLSS